MVVLRSLALAAALAAAGAAQAHVTLQPTAAPAGAYQVLRFGVGHGCDGAATTALRLEIPAAVTIARPQPKPGWRLAIERDGEAVRAITWRGRLPADEFDEFLLLAKLPAEAGPLDIPAVQTCGARENRWVEPTPADGPRPTHPAPRLTIEAAPASAGHDAHH